jgi:primosomal protein N' (replication factor Y) (superfamily II helicase)
MYADVAVCLPLSRTFVYELNGPVEIGSRVVVPFRNREEDGFIVALRKDVPAGIKAQQILQVVDPIPLICPDIFKLCRWISDYYLAPFGEVLKAALPPGITQKHVERVPGSAVIGDFSPRSEVNLTTDQLTALFAIQETPGFHTILLHGVTGSGKTEVYLRAVEYYLAQGKPSLILVPEIGLTPQLTERFSGRFPGMTAILHSSLTKRQRIDEWLRIRSGAAPIVIGTRSAVFAPLENLGLIVVDEEHETTYKQEEMPRYNARDTAVMRAKLAGCAVVLGSATPSMESFHNAEAKKYIYVSMSTRVEDRSLPVVEIVNMRDEFHAEGKQVIFSRRLLDAVTLRLERREQTMILLNRRGFASYLLCRHCGFTFMCTSCSVAMTFHRGINKLLCHYCGSAKRPPTRCTDCNSEYVYYVGEGTERIEADLRELFPDARIGRIDRDTMRHLRDYQRALGDFRKGDIDLLVGTQMIAKGHDFPNVTLVGVVAADAALSLPDFRAAERTFQLLTQVAGRSGRGEQSGEVIIQSYFPDHYAFQLACTHRFEDFYAREAKYRKAMFYPPFTSLAGIMVLDRDAAAAARLARKVADFLESVRSDSIRILGPAPAPLEKLKKVFRHQLLLKSSSRPALHDALHRLQQHLEEQKIGPTKVIVDVDPVSLL